MSYITLSTRKAIAVFGIGCVATMIGACTQSGSGEATGTDPVTATVTATGPANQESPPAPESPTQETPGDGVTDRNPPATTPADHTPPSMNCHSQALDVSVLGQQGAAGSVIYTLGFTNHSDQPCDLAGYPGVSFVGNENGTQIGAAAVREPGVATERLRLEPGETVTSEVRASRAENHDPAHCGEMIPADGFRIYPPENTAALFVPLEGMNGCTDDAVRLLSVQPLTAG